MNDTSGVVECGTLRRPSADSGAETGARGSSHERVTVSQEDRQTLERWIRMPTAKQRVVLRSRIVLLLAAGYPAREVARRLGVSRPTIALWRHRYAEGGCDALVRDRPGRGRKKSRMQKGSP